MEVSAPEFNKTTNVSWGLLIMGAICCLFIGGVAVKVLDNDDELSEVKEELMEKIDEVSSRIDRKIKNHELIYHKDEIK